MTDEFAFLSSSTTTEWQQWITENVSIEEEDVTLAESSTISTAQFGCAAKDVDVNENGDLTILDSDGGMNVLSIDSETLRSLDLLNYEDAITGRPDAVGSMKDAIYIFNTAEGEVAEFSRHSRRHNWTLEFSGQVRTVVGSRRRVYVLESKRESGSGRIQVLEPEEQIRTVFEGLDSPLDMTCTSADNLYVLDNREDRPAVLQVESDVDLFEDTATEIAIPFPEEFTPEYIETNDGTVLNFIGTVDENRSELLKYYVDDDTIERYSIPPREWTSFISGTNTDTDTAGYLQADGSVRQITEKTVYRKDPESLRYEGRLIGRFDSGVSDMEWHRATFDIGELRPDTRISVNYFTSNGQESGIDDFRFLSGLSEEELGALKTENINGLGGLVQRSTKELQEILDDTEPERVATWKKQAEQFIQISLSQRDDLEQVQDPTDMLLEDASGRYLYLDIHLVGNRNISPRLNGVKVYCPRKSYIRYLPEVYQDNEGNAEFLTRFLSIFESVFVDIEDELDRQTEYLDPQEIPLPYLSWLNEWLGVEQGETWPGQARRELLLSAPELYKQRGTKEGLLELLQIYLDHVQMPENNWQKILVKIERRLEELVDDGYLTSREAATQLERYRETLRGPTNQEMYIFEHDQLEWVPEKYREIYYRTLIGHPRRLQILLQPAVPAQYVNEIHNIIETETPAHLDADVKTLDKRFRLGGNTYLGVNTVHPKRGFALGESLLGQSTVLEPE